ncbi:transcription factor FapR [Dehalobacterium formicoaceticum]|uniref:Transcription factor FapR n=1 Tax=Dehalobacterium formicoaceticum TaxID=51515 RepID=A0ABT1XZZ9_9FIRM|nr:transcription factor FapR [Dehalobacterium formicoaceticum]MCR6544191.1 transcription factor FapR [Dehalobacterium formicoaceticum]
MEPRFSGRKKRHQYLEKYLEMHPFVTDDELAQFLGVSVATIRLDRQILGIPEVRKRTRFVAQDAFEKPTALDTHEVVGELMDLELNKSAISVLTITEDMVLAKTKIARGHHLFAQANSLAVAVVGAEIVFTGSARIRYKRPVYLGEKIVAKATVKTQRGTTFLISVHSKVDLEIVFKAQIVLSVQDHKFKRD